MGGDVKERKKEIQAGTRLWRRGAFDLFWEEDELDVG